jgi:hypothetical protein
MTAPPLVPAPVYGLRTWRVVADYELEGGGDGERIAGPYQGPHWPAAGAWFLARCAQGTDHTAPDRACGCGVHAFHPSRQSARRVLSGRRDVAGIVEAHGAVEVHDDGFRAERARPYAFVVTPGRNANLVRRLGEAYHARVLEIERPDELLAYCRAHGLGLDESVVLDLLGREQTLARRLAERKRVHAYALRTAAVVIGVAIVLLLGLQFAVEPPDHSLYGRTGEVPVQQPGDR